MENKIVIISLRRQLDQVVLHEQFECRARRLAI
jgi:hypothetical protein